jgi:hypothetical protein
METTVKLAYPIKVNGKDVIELKMRRPIVADLKQVEQTGGGENERAAAMLGRLTGLVPEDFEKLDLVDFKKLDQAYTDFLEASPGAST